MSRFRRGNKINLINLNLATKIIIPEQAKKDIIGRIRGGNRGDLTRMRQEPNPYKGMTPPSTQNLKALGLWVFFLICCSTFSFIPNVGLRLTLIPNNLPLK